MVIIWQNRWGRNQELWWQRSGLHRSHPVPGKAPGNFSMFFVAQCYQLPQATRYSWNSVWFNFIFQCQECWWHSINVYFTKFHDTLADSENAAYSFIYLKLTDDIICIYHVQQDHRITSVFLLTYFGLFL